MTSCPKCRHQHDRGLLQEIERRTRADLGEKFREPFMVRCVCLTFLKFVAGELVELSAADRFAILFECPGFFEEADRVRENR